MASAITLEGIDQAISNLKYKNKNTLKYRYVQQIRQYYTSEKSVVFLNEIEHEELIKMLWDTDHSFETIKNKRKNLNGVRSSVNTDLKKLYEKGENPEGIKIGSNNIFLMSEDAKDKILKKIGYDLQPDGTLKLDQIMDILKLANETVSGSMANEDKEKKNGVKKIDRLKDLIKGLSEKVGLGPPESSKEVHEADDMASRGYEKGSGSMEMAEVLDEEPLDEVEDLVSPEDEVEVVDDVEDVEELDEEEIVDGIEDVEIDEVAETDTEDLVETAEIDEELEDVLDEEDAELDDVEDVEEVEEIVGNDISDDMSDEFGAGGKDTPEGIGFGQESGQEPTGIDIGKDGELSKDAGKGLYAVGKEDGGGGVGDIEEKGYDQGSGSMEMAEVLDEEPLDEVEDLVSPEDEVEVVDDVEDLEELDEEEIVDDIEDVEIDEIADTEIDDLVETAEIDEELEDVLDEEDAELDDVEEIEEIVGDDISEDISDEFGAGGEDTPEGIGFGQESGQEPTGIDIGKDGEQSKDAGKGLEAVGKEDGGGGAGDIEEKGYDQGSGSMEMAEVLDEEPLDEEEIVDDIEDVEIDEIADTEIDDLVETAEIDEELEDVLDEEDAELDDVEDVEEVEEIVGNDISENISDEFGAGGEDTREGIGFGQDSGQEPTGIDIGKDGELSKDAGKGLDAVGKEDGKNVADDIAENVEHRFEVGEEQTRDEQLGLPIGSLGQEYNIENDGKIRNNKLLSEEFDGYLGSMDRYYNYYVLIPGGEYLIGSKYRKKDEKSEQKVYLEPFYIGRFPITNGLFEIFVEKTGYKTTAEKVGYGTVYYGRFEKKKDETTGLITSTWNSSLYCKIVKSACWYQPSGAKSTLYNKRNHPVVQISLEDATAFAAWTGKRLPTENEWEAASRTANGWILPWGQEWKRDVCNIEDSCTADTTPVDKYIEFENNFGIVDTIGNVLEWTDDSFDSTSQKIHGAKYKAAKGGSWISGNDIRLFSRSMIKPEWHSNILGFRCVAY